MEESSRFYIRLRAPGLSHDLYLYQSPCGGSCAKPANPSSGAVSPSLDGPLYVLTESQELSPLFTTRAKATRFVHTLLDNAAAATYGSAALPPGWAFEVHACPRVLDPQSMSTSNAVDMLQSLQRLAERHF